MQGSFLLSHCSLISLTAVQTLSNAFWKSKPTVSTRSLLPMCLLTPSKNSSRLVKHVGSSPKKSDLSMCQLILLGQMLGLVAYSALDHIKKPLPSLGEQSWLQTTVSSSPWVHAEVLGERHLGLEMGWRSFGRLGFPTDTSVGGGYSGDSPGKEDCGGRISPRSSMLNPGVKSALSFSHMALFFSVCSF